MWNLSLCSPFLDRVQTNMSNICSAFILNFCTINKCTKVSADLVCYRFRVAFYFAVIDNTWHFVSLSQFKVQWIQYTKTTLNIWKQNANFKRSSYFNLDSLLIMKDNFLTAKTIDSLVCDHSEKVKERVHCSNR